MSSDDGWIIQNDLQGKYVLLHYFASADELPNPNLNVPDDLKFDTLEEAVLKYDELESESMFPCEYGLTLRLSKNHMEKKTMVYPVEYLRKQFSVEAIQITAENMWQVAEWCGGEVKDERPGVTNSAQYIDAPVDNPQTERHKQGFIGDWVLKSGRGFKIYTDAAFNKSFELPVSTVETNVFTHGQGGGASTFTTGFGGAGGNPGGTTNH